MSQVLKAPRAAETPEGTAAEKAADSSRETAADTAVVPKGATTAEGGSFSLPMP